ncbi:HI0933 family flavoprotein [Rickettsiales bacterium Ac37b]|nr:HI0933 family flavoprotein [Rickettsiales bacterium Ac37b]
MKQQKFYEVIIVGAGAAGLMAAIAAGKRSKTVLLIEHTNKIGEKIRISGGGRCNFTNINTSSNNYLSENIHFAKSALASFTQHHFIKLVESYNIEYFEKTLGQLFCKNSSRQIIEMLLEECRRYQVEIKLNTIINQVTKNDYFSIASNMGEFNCRKLIIATGGLSIPQMGASNFGYELAKKFDLHIIPTKPALVPLTLKPEDKILLSKLSGISNKSIVKYLDKNFAENILFTHKGLSGPAILQISSYLENFNDKIVLIDLLPDINLHNLFLHDKNNKQTVANYLKPYLSNRLIEFFKQNNEIFAQKLTEIKKEKLIEIAKLLHNFQIVVTGSEGYNKAEVTKGGIDTEELSSKTMECKKVSNLYFVGEVVDVTGWLGGYNFQWAWSSGFVAGNSC